MKNASLAVRLLIWILPAVLGVTLVLASTSYLIAEASILDELSRNVLAVAQTAAVHVRGFFQQRENDLATIGQSPLFRDHFMNLEYGLAQEAEMHRREIERMLLAFARRARIYPRLRYLDASGRELVVIRDLAAAAPLGRDRSELFARLSRERTGRRLTSGIERRAWHRHALVAYGMRLQDDAGRLRGALIFDCSLGPVYDTLDRLRIGYSGRNYLSRRASAAEGSSGVSKSRGLITATAVVPGTPWKILTVVSRADFVERLERIRIFTMLLIAAGIAFIVVIVSSQLRELLRPIRELVDAVSQYAGGRMGTRVSVSGPSEVAALSTAFNTMADRLEARTETLKQRVRELTYLHRMNDVALRQMGRGAIGRACLEAAVLGLGFERGVMYWVDEERGELVGECVFGADALFRDDVVRKRRIPIAGGDILAHVVQTRAPVLVEDATKDPRCNPAFVAEAGTRSFCAAPIIARDRVIAVLCVDFPRSGQPMEAEHARSFSLFCSAAGLALENAQLLEKIVASEARYRTAVEDSPHTIIGLDQNMRVTLWNRRAEAMFGYQPSEARGRTLDFVIDRKGYDTIRREVEVTGAVRQAEAVGRTRDGRPLQLNISWTGQASGLTGAREWFVSIQDETEKKGLESQLIRAEKLSAVGSLVAGVAHELNNPLCAVTGFAELLREVDLPGPYREDMEHLHASAMRCRDIIGGLLRFARQEREPAPRRISLNAVMESVVALSSYRLERGEGIALSSSPDSAEPMVAGHRPRLEQLLVNLVGNARDALKGRLGRREIRVRTRRLDKCCELEVEDTGPGVPPALREKIFEPFFTTKSAGHGTGLGLAIAGQIVAEAGGTLRCEAGPEGGARFVARFPLCPAEVPADQTVSTLPAASPGRRVLVVDDEPELVELMVRFLSGERARTERADDSREALALLRRGRYDLVVADIDMGREGGLHLLREARRLEACPAFLFVTGDVFNTELGRDLAATGVEVLAKPFTREQFVRAVRGALVSAI